MQIDKIEYFDGEKCLEASVAYPVGEGSKPIIFIFHPWGGKGAFVEEKALELAEMGYIGCALDLYGKGVLEEDKDTCAALMSPFIENREMLLKRILAYKDLLPKIPRADKKSIGAIGYCFGGLAALDLARSGEELKGVVSFHGLLTPPKSASEQIKAKVQVMHGYKDPMVPKEEILAFCDEMEEKKADYQFHIFGNTLHAFTNPASNDVSFGVLYNKQAEKDSWELMKSFFSQIL